MHAENNIHSHIPHRWIDTHCHLDAAEFAADRDAVRSAARQMGVAMCVLPAVEAKNFLHVRQLAHQWGDAYALGIHPMYVPQATEADLHTLEQTLQQHRDDPHLVAVGEIGLDFFVPELCTTLMRERQQRFYRAQLKLARRFDLPVILHTRHALDAVIHGLRQTYQTATVCGIAHAFSGSEQQAQQCIALGLKLGMGGALTFDRAQRLRRLASSLPLQTLVLETDAPDMPPCWIYTPASQRTEGQVQMRNTPSELPRIAQVLADLRKISLQELCAVTLTNSVHALPKLAGLNHLM